MKKIYGLALLLLLVGCGATGMQEDTGETEPMRQSQQVVQNIAPLTANPYSGQVGDDQPISRGVVNRMVAHAFTPYELTSVEEFDSDQLMTLAQAQEVLAELGVNIHLTLTPENQEAPVSHALWNELFLRALNERSGGQAMGHYFGIWERPLVILATEANNEQLAGGHVITPQGRFQGIGLNLENFVDQEVMAWVRGDQILGVTAVSNETPLLSFAYVVSATDSHIHVFSGGVQRAYRLSAGLEAQHLTGEVVSLVIRGQEAISIYPHLGRLAGGSIERITGSAIELYGIGTKRLAHNLSVYHLTASGINFGEIGDLIVGTNLAYFVTEDEAIVAAIITSVPKPYYIRVALSTTGFTSLIHPSVSIRSAGEMTLRKWEEREVIAPHTIQTFTYPDDQLTRIYIESEAPIEILSISRQWPAGQNPMYEGRMEVATEPGGFSIINILTLEDYLTAVVPSEMPASFGLEAAKIQAVTARSFAHNEFFSNRHGSIGANVVDSVMSQVYNNIPPTDISREAVAATKGQVLMYEGAVISANFFSTSAGVTANAGDVWPRNNVLPAPTAPFLQTVRQYVGADFGDLSQEDQARVFFNTRDINAFDDMSPWFRWDTQMTAAQVASSINAGLQERFQANPALIKTKGADGVFRSEPVQTIGELVDISVVRRGAGGNIKELEVVGTENTLRIITEFNIRSLIAPMDHTGTDETVLLNRWDGSVLNNFTMMPSSFFTMERLTNGNGDILYVRFIGGGFGHGAGMSQYGARGMLNRGFSYIEVLEHFYTGATVGNIWAQ